MTVKSYDAARIQDRLYELMPAAWKQALADQPQLASATWSIVGGPLPDNSAAMLIAIMDAQSKRMGLLNVLSNGGVVVLHPELMGGFGNLFDDETSPRMLASVILKIANDGHRLETAESR